MLHVGNFTYYVWLWSEFKNKHTKKYYLRLASGNMKKVDMEHTDFMFTFRFYVCAYIVTCETANICGQKHFREGTFTLYSLENNDTRFTNKALPRHRVHFEIQLVNHKWPTNLHEISYSFQFLYLFLFKSL